MTAPGITAIAFDVDGTLWDDNATWWPSVLETSRRGVQMATGRVEERLVGECAESYRKISDYVWTLRSTMILPGESQSDVRARLWQSAFESCGHVLRESQIVELVTEFSRMRLTGIKLPQVEVDALVQLACMHQLAICSNGFLEEQTAKLQELGILHLFSAIVCAGDSGLLKPASHPFRALADLLDCPSDECLYVGDSWEEDVEGAQKSGMQPVYFAREKFPGTRITNGVPTISSFTSLVNFLAAKPI